MGDNKSSKGLGFNGLEEHISDVESLNIRDKISNATPHVHESAAIQSNSALTNNIHQNDKPDKINLTPHVSTGKYKNAPSNLFKLLGEHKYKFIGWFAFAAFIVYCATENNGSSQTASTGASSSSNYRVSSGNLQEEKPPVGSGISFNSNQIAYCVSEKIRIKGMRDIVNQYSSSEISLLNSYVDDYNGRCSSFKYRRGSYESVKGSIEANRYSIELDGGQRILAIR